MLAVAWMLMLKLALLQVRGMVPNATFTALFLATSVEQSDTSSARRDLVSDPRQMPLICAIAIGCGLAYLVFK